MGHRPVIFVPTNSAFSFFALLALSFSCPCGVHAQAPSASMASHDIHSKLAAIVPANTVAPPSAPSSLTATATSAAKVSLTWPAAAAGGLPIANYRVYRGPSASNLTQLAITTKTSYNDTTVSAGETYYYAVQTSDTQGNLSPLSPAAKAIVPNLPSPPAGLSGTAMSTAKVSLKWDAAGSGGLPIANYRVYKGSSASGMTQLAITTQTSYTDTTASAGATYYYGVQAADTGGDLSAISPAVEFTEIMPPSAPAGVVATPTSTTNATVTWDVAASGGLPIQNYRVYKGSSPSSLTQLATTANTSYTDRTLSAGATYYYAVEANDTGQDLSPMSTVAPVTAFTPPSAPTGLSATPLSATRVSLTWSPAASGGLPVKYYEIFRGTSPSSLSKIATATQTSYTDNSLSSGTTYYYGVEAEDSAMDLSPMSSIVPSTGFTAPSAPTNLVATPTAATKVSLTWSAASGGGLPVTYYQVFRGSSASNLVKLATVAQTSFTDTSVSSTATYYYGVEAQDSAGDLSAMSAAAQVTVPSPPSPPTGLAPTPNSASLVSVTWSPAASGGLPVTYYQIFRGTSPSGLSQVATVTQTSYMDQSVNAGTKYYYAAEAQDSGGDLSSMSAASPVTVPTPPSAPTGLAATPTSATMVSLTWTASVSGGLPITYYQVWRGTSPSKLIQVATVAQAAATDISLTPGATYYYAVHAQDSGGDLSPLAGVVPATLFTPPTVPSGLQTAVTANIAVGAAQATYSVSLTWNASSSGGVPVSFYQVLRGTSSSSLSQVGSVTQTSYTDNSVIAATTYYYALIAADTAGDLSAQSPSVAATTSNGQATGLFNLLPMNVNSFSPSSTVLSGLPQMSIDGTLFDDVGYQSGVVLNGKMIYNANEVWQGGNSSWMGAVSAAVPMPVFMSYNTTQQLGGFGIASNWTYFDSSTLSWYSKGTPQTANTGNQCIAPENNTYCLNIAGAYMGHSAYVGNIYYPTPDFHNAYMVFLSYDSSKPINDPSAYQTFVPPGYYLSTMGQQYGWCSSVTDGRFVYYTPLGNPVTGNSGNIFRYDTTQPFSNLTTGGQTSAWQNFDMQTTSTNPGGISPNAAGFQSSAYDGYRYIYFIPFQQTLIVRYDTWNGGSGPDPTGFSVAANYTPFDPTQLGTSGYPAVAGQGSTANLAGFTGAQVVWDAANQNEYLYLVPWGTYPNNAVNPTLQSTAARVRIGAMTGSNWSAVDITSTATSPASSTPNWQMYDLSLLTQNAGWPSNWPLYQVTPQLSTDSSMAGWQEAWVATSNSEGQTFPPRVGFVPDTSSFIVEHDVGHNLYDPTGWYVTLIPSTYNNGTMGGGYDATNSILYPASPNVPLFAFQF